MIDVQFEGTEPARLQAIRGSAMRLIAKIANPNKEGCVWNLSESLWPALSMSDYAGRPVKNLTLRLVPLSRIGQMEGKSGSLVLIGFFADADDKHRPHSHPVVVKTLSVSHRDKLREEYDNAQSIKPFAYDQKDSFAIPIDFDNEQQDYHVLWSIFSPSDAIWPGGVSDPTTTTLKVQDLRAPLESGDNNAAQPILDSAFRLLSNLHHRLNRAQSEERQFGDEYARYLRKLDDDVWGREWKEAWGQSTTQHIEDAGGHFANPFWVLEQIRIVRKPMYIGAVHGDLHPGNIVLAAGQPRIIDFGWAQDGAHVAKDFVLMECNLRFHTVRPQLSQSDVYGLSDWIEWDAPVPGCLGVYARGRVDLIQRLRNIAKATIQRDGHETDWNWEYLVPLFLVAFGLLRFAPHLGNQQAAVRFVLALATHIERFLDGGE